MFEQRKNNAIALVFCLILILQSVACSQSTEQVEAIRHFEAIGAVLTKDDDGKVVAIQFPEGITFNEQRWRYVGDLTDLRDLDLGAVYVGNDILKHVSKLTELRNLNLFGNPLDSVALTHIENLQKLETLYLYPPGGADLGKRRALETLSGKQT